MNAIPREPQPAPAARLGLWDTASIIVGIIIGVGIYETPAKIFSNSPGPWQAMALWALGGALSLVGALCFAELASTYPRSGGEYVYLTRAFGRGMGFLFAWAQLAVIRTGGGIAVVAYIFAYYACRLLNNGQEDQAGDPTLYAALAVLPIVVLTLVNLVGVTVGKTTQNVLTGLKVVGLAGILLAGFLWASERPEYVVHEGVVVHAGGDWLVLRDGKAEFSGTLAPGARITIKDDDADPTGRLYHLNDLKEGVRVKAVVSPNEGGQIVRVRADVPSPFAGLALAMILVLWTYAGWHEGAYVAAEVRQPRRNLPLALLLGTGAVTVIYLLVNLAYLAGLGYEAAADSRAVAADVLALPLGTWGARAMSLLVVLSALGALNGMIFTSSRIFAEMGADHPLFAPLGHWHSRWNTPVTSLVLQGSLSVSMVVVVSLFWRGQDGFSALVNYTAPAFWLFFLLTGAALVVLRLRDRHLERPFRVPLYPLTPLLFCGCCGVMFYASVSYAPREALIGLGMLATGVPLYLLSRRLRGGPPAEIPPPVPVPEQELVTLGKQT
jgi:basic amino acid/polyamine antiporter, APA family